MSLFNKIIGKPSGRGVGQSLGGTGEFYPLTASLAFLREDFNLSNGGTPDSDEWDLTTAPMTGTGSYYATDGRLFVDLGTSSTGTWTMTSKDSFKIPFRVEAGIGVDGINTGMSYVMRVKDSGGTWLAEWFFIGSAGGGGTEHSASMRVRAGSTALGLIASAAANPSTVTGVAGSACLSYVIDLDFGGITFAMHTSEVHSTAALTSIPPAPSVRSHVKSPTLKANQVYYVEFSARSGTAAEPAGASNTAANGSAFLMLDYVQIVQYSPDAAFQNRQNVLQVYSSTTGTGATAVLGLTQLKWY